MGDIYTKIDEAEEALEEARARRDSAVQVANRLWGEYLAPVNLGGVTTMTPEEVVEHKASLERWTAAEHRMHAAWLEVIRRADILNALLDRIRERD